MPIIKSAIKRVRQTERRTRRNEIIRKEYKRVVKEFTILAEAGKTAEAQKLFSTVQKTIDTAAKKNVLDKNTASRKKSRLSKMINTQKTTTKATPKAAAPAKKAAPKKTTKKAE